MYKEFFNFSAEPFRVTPDPGFLYLTDQHKEALAAIIYGIAKRKGFVCITGEVGVGKTTILRSYLDSVDEPGLRLVYVYNPNVSFQTLLRHIFKEISLDYPGAEIAGMVDALRAWLIERHANRETLVLLIDEAQNMPIGTLESLRLLSNLETATEKLVQVVLVGQPELEQLLAERQLRQLESRIAVRTRLGPLSRNDAVAYIRHRLKCVALSDTPAFSDAAIAEIVRHAAGIPRRINVLADNTLLTAFGHKVKPVPARVVREVARDLKFREGGRGGRLARVFARLARSSVPSRPMPGGGRGSRETAETPARRSWGWGLGSVAVVGATLLGWFVLHERGPISGDKIAIEIPPPKMVVDPPLPLLPALPPESTPVLLPEPPRPPTLVPEVAVRMEPTPPSPAPDAVAGEPMADGLTGPDQEMPKETMAQASALLSELSASLASTRALSQPPGTPLVTNAKDILKVVAPGDTLAELTYAIYGRRDRAVLVWVKKHNPEITSVDVIQVGQIIAFPQAPEQGFD